MLVKNAISGMILEENRDKAALDRSHGCSKFSAVGRDGFPRWPSHTNENFELVELVLGIDASLERRRISPW